MIKVAINGFGRIGRMVFKAGIKDKHIQFVAINDLTSPENLAYLLKHDTVYGKSDLNVSAKDNNLVVNGKTIPVFTEKDPAKLPWAKLKVDIVAECTGFFEDPAKAKAHLDAGAKKVLVSAPCKCEKEPYPYKTLVMGVNDKEYKGEKIVSNGSCTTNCLAPMAKVLNDIFHIKTAFLTTTHAYTATQNLIDGPNKQFSRGRSAALNIVPSSTGAAKALHEVIPSLKGKMDGVALRVPVVCGSITDFVCEVEKKTTAEEVNQFFKKAAQGPLKNILEYSEDELVSTDILGNPHSVIFNAKLTKVLNNNFIQVFGWYDNEWGFSCRMIDVVKLMAKK